MLDEDVPIAMSHIANARLEKKRSGNSSYWIEQGRGPRGLHIELAACMRFGQQDGRYLDEHPRLNSSFV
ncbi:hypothetical protein [Burkholderia ubonensis]|uniref:hypothetical protein n=1 Tax=Burkholderia ubonensis TaxID=101571 RepID=UPI0012FC6A8C|nr:hypothetical protein [Burkholderia ubonensis]